MVARTLAALPRYAMLMLNYWARKEPALLSSDTLCIAKMISGCHLAKGEEAQGQRVSMGVTSRSCGSRRATDCVRRSAPACVARRRARRGAFGTGPRPRCTAPTSVAARSPRRAPSPSPCPRPRGSARKKN